MTPRHYPSVDESFGRLHRAGWSIGEIGSSGVWLVTGTNGENVIHAQGRSQAEAWYRATLQAEAVGMLAVLNGGRAALASERIPTTEQRSVRLQASDPSPFGFGNPRFQIGLAKSSCGRSLAMRRSADLLLNL